MKLVLNILFVSLSVISTFAQNSSPVSWSFESQETEDGQYKISLTADIESGWAIYSQFTAEGGPIPTSFEFEENDNITLIKNVIEPDEKEQKFDELFEIDVIKLKGKPEFYQMAQSSVKGSTLKGFLTYMCCDDSKCLPPTDVEFAIKVE